MIYAPAPATQTRIIAPVETKAVINVTLPADAVVYLRDQRMTITGPTRRYTIPLTNTSKTYEYPLRVEFQGEDGQKTEAITTLSIKAGSRIDVKVADDESLQVTLAKK